MPILYNLTWSVPWTIFLRTTVPTFAKRSIHFRRDIAANDQWYSALRANTESYEWCIIYFTRETEKYSVNPLSQMWHPVYCREETHDQIQEETGEQHSESRKRQRSQAERMMKRSQVEFQASQVGDNMSTPDPMVDWGRGDPQNHWSFHCQIWKWNCTLLAPKQACYLWSTCIWISKSVSAG